jgi:hypothetical protein
MVRVSGPDGHDLGTGASPSLRRIGWSAMVQGHISLHWNLDLSHWERDLRVLRVDRSPGASPDNVESRMN